METTAPALAAQALDKELNAGASTTSAPPQTVVNDLTSMVVKKKKKAPVDATAGKRKAEAEIDSEPSTTEKKPRLDTPDS